MLLPRSSRLWPRRKSTGTVLQLLALFLILLLLQTRISHSPAESVRNLGTGATPSRSPLLQEQATFWRDLYLIILNNDPHCEHPPEAVVPHKLDIVFDPSHDHPRPDILWMGPADINRMRESHTNFVSDIKRSPPRLIYEEKSRGIAMTAGFGQLPVLVTSIRMLRSTSSRLPVEVFLADISNYDDEICETVLPSLDAKCLLFSDVFETADSQISLDHYQYKVMAVLFSSFEHVLLLDADAFPIRDPLPLFEQNPFNDTGMVVWPDFWYVSESPYYFEIAKLPSMPSLNARASMESGQILYSKSKHSLSIMLATYYNFWGPNYYYPLLSQGAPGQGDKETFAWAATALGEPLYAVKQSVVAVGRLDSGGEFLGSAMAQHDPIADFARLGSPGDASYPDQHAATGSERSESAYNLVRPFFVHVNFPKFDPSVIFDHDDGIATQGGLTRDTNGTSVRCWMDKEQAITFFGFDLEYHYWEQIKHTACIHEHQFGCWKGKRGICQQVTRYWHEVFQPTSSSMTGALT